MRITKKNLVNVVANINREVGANVSAVQRDSEGEVMSEAITGRTLWNVGTYLLDHGHGGYRLEVVTSVTGSTRDILGERLPAGALYGCLHAYWKGLTAGAAHGKALASAVNFAAAIRPTRAD